MADEWEDSGEELTPEEQQILRFQFENELDLKAAHLGFDVDRFVHENEAGRHLIETAIDTVHNAMVELIDADLASDRARDLQVQGRAGKLVIDTVLQALENGRNAAFALADKVEIEEDSNDE